MSLADYSALEKEIDEAPEPITLPNGSEVKARIISVRDGISDKNDAHWYTVVFDVPASTLAKEYSDFFWDLLDLEKLEGGRSGKQALSSMRKFKNFALSFGIDYSKPFSWADDLPGLTGWQLLGVKKSEEYGDQNTVKKYLAKK